MTILRILSWNVNGLRAVYKKGFLGWFTSERPAIMCVQETKVSPEQIPEELRLVEGYEVYYVSADRKGYSGVGLFTKLKPRRVEQGLGIRKFDVEGRVIIADYTSFILFNVYFPTGKISKDRLKFKLAFYDEFLAHIDKLRRRGKKLIICGDVNTAHREIDLSRPKENAKISGFLPEERLWIDRLLDHGFIDTFRVFNKQAGQYTWWDVKTRARQRNVGWRIDCFYVTENLLENLKAAFILSDITGSDHCPIGVDIAI